MKSLLDKHYELINTGDSADGIAFCQELNQIHRQKRFESKFCLEKTFGRGYYRRIRPDQAMEITACDFTFHQEILMGEIARGSAYHLLFCLADAIEYEIQELTERLDEDTSCIYLGDGIRSRSCFHPGQHYYSIGVHLSPTKYVAVSQCLDAARAATDLNHPTGVSRKYKMTPAVKTILWQIVNNPCQDSLQGIYLEGKILELLAVYLNEMVREEREGPGTVKLSLQDVDSLYQARAILDRSYADPPTIAILAKLTYLNEFKLKSGFKEIFGMPIYAYVINKRMETALVLLKAKELQVREVASRVGYTNISHFSVAFRKKFGVNPGSYQRN